MSEALEPIASLVQALHMDDRSGRALAGLVATTSRQIDELVLPIALISAGVVQATRAYEPPDHPEERRGRPLARAVRVAVRGLRWLYRCNLSASVHIWNGELAFVLVALERTNWLRGKSIARKEAELLRLFGDRRCDPGGRHYSLHNSSPRSAVAERIAHGRLKQIRMSNAVCVRFQRALAEELRRILAVMMAGDGVSQAEVAFILDCRKSAVSKWVSADRKLGWSALQAKPRGRPRKG